MLRQKREVRSSAAADIDQRRRHDRPCVHVHRHDSHRRMHAHPTARFTTIFPTKWCGSRRAAVQRVCEVYQPRRQRFALQA